MVLNVLRRQSPCSPWVNTDMWFSLAGIMAHLELVSHIGMALNRKGADWNLGLVSPSRVVLASRSDSEKEMFAKLKGQTSGPLCQPNALLNVLCSACWSWDPVASRREEDSFLYEWPNDRCTIFCPRKACQVVGISGWLVLNKIQEKFHLVNPGEVPGFCFCVLFFLL